MRKEGESRKGDIIPRSRKIPILLPLHRSINIKHRLKRLAHTHDNHEFKQYLAHAPQQLLSLLCTLVLGPRNQVFVEARREVGLAAADYGCKLHF